MVSTKYSSLTDRDLITALGVLSSVHNYFELIFGFKIDDFGQAAACVLLEGERRSFRVVDNINLKDLDKKRLTRMIRGAIDMTIKAHGPITEANSFSAAKRAVGFLLRSARK